MCKENIKKNPGGDEACSLLFILDISFMLWIAARMNKKGLAIMNSALCSFQKKGGNNPAPKDCQIPATMIVLIYLVSNSFQILSWDLIFGDSCQKTNYTGHVKQEREIVFKNIAIIERNEIQLF